MFRFLQWTGIFCSFEPIINCNIVGNNIIMTFKHFLWHFFDSCTYTVFLTLYSLWTFMLLFKHLFNPLHACLHAPPVFGSIMRFHSMLLSSEILRLKEISKNISKGTPLTTNPLSCIYSHNNLCPFKLMCVRQVKSSQVKSILFI